LSLTSLFIWDIAHAYLIILLSRGVLVKQIDVVCKNCIWEIMDGIAGKGKLLGKSFSFPRTPFLSKTSGRYALHGYQTVIGCSMSVSKS